MLVELDLARSFPELLPEHPSARGPQAQGFSDEEGDDRRWCFISLRVRPLPDLRSQGIGAGCAWREREVGEVGDAEVVVREGQHDDAESRFELAGREILRPEGGGGGRPKNGRKKSRNKTKQNNYLVL